MSGIRTVVWALWLAFVAMVALAAYLGFNPPSGPPITVVDAIWATSFIGFPTAGALIVQRLPRRPLGWILLVAPLLLMIGLALSELARHATHDISLAQAMLWPATVFLSAGFGPLLTILLYLPDGYLASSRWRWVAKIVWSIVPLAVLHAALKPGPLEAGSGNVMNPLGLDALKPLSDVTEAVLPFLFFGMIGAGLISLIARSRRARGIERPQLKWLALGAAGILICFGSIALFEAFIRDLGDAEVTAVIVLAILSLPASIAIAVLKTRLYDVDVIINRTLVYGTLTAILASSYFGIVVVLQRLLEPVTRQSDLAVAGSTLAVAAVARPLLRRVQDFIDRRFYRRKYDAAETLTRFSAHLRDHVDLDALERELVSVVGSTMQPAHTSLWLRSQVGP